MKFKKVLLFMIVQFFLFNCGAVSYKKGVVEMDKKFTPKSVKSLIDLVAAAKTPKEGKNIVQDWQKKQANLSFPLIEGKQVTFLFYDFYHQKGLGQVALRASFNSFVENDFLERVPGTHLFYKTYQIDNPDNITYSFLLKINNMTEQQLDPFNLNVKLGKPHKSIIRTINSELSTIQLHHKVKPLGDIYPRDVFVYLPPGYFKDSAKKYPVIYMQDGQQLWDSPSCSHGGWKVDTAMDRMVKAGKIKPAIIVGIANSAVRTREYIGYSAYYKFNPNKVSAKEIKRYNNSSKIYGDFIVKELKPQMDALYRTKTGRADTAIAGSSFGASISLYIGFTYKNIFSTIGAFSFGHYALGDSSRNNKNFYNISLYLKEKVIPKKNGPQVYLDCGGQGVDFIFRPVTEKLHKFLLARGYKEGDNLSYKIYPPALHNESEWAIRVPIFLEFVLKK